MHFSVFSITQPTFPLVITSVNDSRLRLKLVVVVVVVVVVVGSSVSVVSNVDVAAVELFMSFEILLRFLVM